MQLHEYATRFETVALDRTDGVLELRVHTNDGPLQWSRTTHRELAEAFACIARDPDNEVLILTGTGDAFSGPSVAEGDGRRLMGPQSVSDWHSVFIEGRRLIFGLLDLEIPVISAVNGPAYRHPELPLLADVILASTTMVMQDAAHFNGGLVPGDGVHVVYPALMGPARARYFLMTGQTLNAQEALDIGIVNEVLPPGDLLPRAHQLAAGIMAQPRFVRRFTRLLLAEELRDRMQRLLPLGLALEGMAILDGNSEFE